MRQCLKFRKSIHLYIFSWYEVKNVLSERHPVVFIKTKWPHLERHATLFSFLNTACESPNWPVHLEKGIGFSRQLKDAVNMSKNIWRQYSLLFIMLFISQYQKIIVVLWQLDQDWAFLYPGWHSCSYVHKSH